MASQIGLAGARRRELRERMRETLTPLDIGEIEVVTDANIALYGATGGAPGLVVIAGTGSICCGINARRKRSCAGGWGVLPIHPAASRVWFNGRTWASQA